MRHFIGIPVAALFTLVGTARAEVPATAVISTDIASPTTSRIDVTLIGAPGLPASALTLRDAGDPRSAAVRATSVRSFAEGDEPLALAIVYNGQEVWLGNDTFETDDEARYIGALPGLARAIDSLAQKRFPAGSEAALIAYADGVTTRLPMTPIARLHGSAIGAQLDYRNKIGSDLVIGVEEGIHQLERSHAPLKALIVIGDGNDTNNDAAKDQLLQLKRRAARDKIETFAVIYKGDLSDPSQVITSMIPATRTVNTFDSMAGVIDAFLDRIGDRSYVTFSAENLAWDGLEHALVVRAAGDDLDPEYTLLPLHAHAKPWYRHGWWQQLGAGFGLVVLLAFGLRLTFRRAIV